MSKILKNILCIDDEEDILEILKECLESIGKFNVTCCADPQVALDKIDSTQPDLILLDAMMPEIDGLSLLWRIRMEEKRVPVIFLTARLQSAMLKEYIEKGAIGVIGKPFDPILLPSQIVEIWNKSVL